MTYFQAILQVVLFCGVFAIVVWAIAFLLDQSAGESKNSGSIVKGLILGAATGTCVGLGGFFLANAPATRGMGQVMFLLVPFCAGFAIAMVTRGRSTAWASSLLAVLGCLSILVASKLEGVLLCNSGFSSAGARARGWRCPGLPVSAVLYRTSATSDHEYGYDFRINARASSGGASTGAPIPRFGSA